MSDVIKAQGVDFSYRVLTNHQSSLKTLFKDFVNRKVRVENYQALKDLSFSVTKGETVAIGTIKKNTSVFCPDHFDQNPTEQEQYCRAKDQRIGTILQLDNLLKVEPP